MSFADSIKAFEQKALLAMNKSVSNAIESVFTDTVVLSPEKPEASYATGLLKNSWYVMAGGGFDETKGTSPDQNGSSSLSRIKSTLAESIFLGRDNTITLTNSVDHAYRANYLGWPTGDNSTGWHWTGKVQAYRFVQNAVNNFKGKYMV